MRRTIRLTCSLPVAFSLLFLASCQGGSSSPTAPTGSHQAADVVLPLIPTSEPGDGGSFQMVSGVYTLDLTLSESPAAELMPVRTAAAKGDAYELDATNFLRVSPCADCLQVTALRRGGSPDEVEVDFSMRHPFPLPTQPYTLASRLDLHAFDVMGYLLSNSDTPIALGDGDTAAPLFLMNADGYSDLLDEATAAVFPTPNVTEHPYRVFFNNPNAGNFDGNAANGFADPASPQGHNVMSMGADFDTVTFTVKVPPSGQVRLGFAVGLSWGQPAQGRGSLPGQRQNPVYYLPEFHHKAPWTVTASVSNNALAPNSPSSSAELEIRLRDWQLGATVDPAWAFDVTPRDQIKGASSLASLRVYAPGLLATPLTIDPGSGAGTGVFDDLVFNTLVTNTASAGEGTYYLYVKAVDSRSPGGAVLDRNIQPVNITDFHTGTVIPVEVIDQTPNTPPTAAFAGTELLLTCKNCTATVDATPSTDLEDPGDLDFEFDFDVPGGDPSNFSPDTPVQSTPTISHQFPTEPAPGFVGVRVTDPDGASDVAILPVVFDPITLGPVVSVAPWVNPLVQYFNHDTASAAMTLSANQNYVFVAVERHNGSGATAGASSEVRVWRTADGSGWTPLPSVSAVNPYGPIWADQALAAGTDGTVYLTFAVQDGGNYGTDWETRIYSITGNGSGSWSLAMADTSVAAQPNSRFLFVDPVTPNLVILQNRMNSGVRQWRSTNGAAGPWTLTAPIGGSPNGLTLLRKPNGHLVSTYIDASGDAIRAQTSTDAGASFTLTGSLLLDPANNWMGGCGAIDPADTTGNTMVYAFRAWVSAGGAGTPGINLARTTNGGASWTNVNNSVETTSEYQPGDPAILRAMYDAQGGLYVTYFKALWGADNRGFVAYSGDNGTTFLPDEQVYDTNPNPSWPGMQLVMMPNGCDMMSVYSRMQNIESRVF